MAATVGSVQDWLPPLLEAELGLSAEQAQQAANHLAKSLFKPSGTKLLRELEHDDRSRWTELMGKLANYVVSLTGGDVGELAKELCEEIAAALKSGAKPAAPVELPVKTDAAAAVPQPVKEAARSAAQPHTPRPSAGTEGKSTPATASLPAGGIETKPETKFAEKLARVEELALAYACKTAGNHWNVTMVDIEAQEGARVGRNYKAGRKARGEGAVKFSSAAREEAAFAAKDKVAAARVERDVSEAGAKMWEPQAYGGTELTNLLKELRVDVVFACPCAPNRVIRIGSLASHRMGAGCEEYLKAREGMECGLRNAAAQMTTPAAQAARVRAGATPVLNVPTQAASTILAAMSAAACSPAAAVKVEPPAPRSTTSGAAKRQKAAARATKKAVVPEWLLQRRRDEAIAQAARKAEQEARECCTDDDVEITAERSAEQRVADELAAAVASGSVLDLSDGESTDLEPDDEDMTLDELYHEATQRARETKRYTKRMIRRLVRRRAA